MPPKKKAVEVQSQDDFEAELKSTPQVAQVFDSKTIGVSPRDGGGYNIVVITLDSKSLEAGEVLVVDTAESKWEANEKFKIAVIKQGVM